MRKTTIICPKCHKRAWKPFKYAMKRESGRKKYLYLIYRHNEKGRKTPRKRYIAIGRKKKKSKTKK